MVPTTADALSGVARPRLFLVRLLAPPQSPKRRSSMNIVVLTKQVPIFEIAGSDSVHT